MGAGGESAIFTDAVPYYAGICVWLSIVRAAATSGEGFSITLVCRTTQAAHPMRHVGHANAQMGA